MWNDISVERECHYLVNSCHGGGKSIHTIDLTMGFALNDLLGGRITGTAMACRETCKDFLADSIRDVIERGSVVSIVRARFAEVPSSSVAFEVPSDLRFAFAESSVDP